MPRRSSSVVVLAAVLVFVVGCDRAAPTDTPVFVGTWTESATIDREFATSTVAQTILDPSRPGEGALTVSGSDAETMRYVGPPFVGPYGDTTWTVSSISLDGGSSPSAYGFASLASYHTDVTLWRGGSYRQYGAEATPATAFRWDGTRLSLPAPRTLTHLDGGTVVLSGSVVPATQALGAGEESLVRTRTSAWMPGEGRETMTFREDGRVRRTSTSPEGEPYAYDGQWEALGDDRLRLSFRSPGSTVEARWEVRYELVGADLHLTFDEHPCATSGAGCLDWRARGYGMTPGTLSDVRVGRTIVFAPTAPG